MTTDVQAWEASVFAVRLRTRPECVLPPLSPAGLLHKGPEQWVCVQFQPTKQFPRLCGLQHREDVRGKSDTMTSTLLRNEDTGC